MARSRTAKKPKPAGARHPRANARPKGARPAAFFARKLGARTLLTNEWGQYAFLSTSGFKRLREGRLNENDPEWEELKRKGFLREYLDFRKVAQDFRKRSLFLWKGPSLHIVVVTLRCNHTCLYCHSSAVRDDRTDTDMSKKTAKATLETIFAGPNPDICVEFQGGEPLLNWPVVEYIVKEARRMNRRRKKRLLISLVTNLTLMDDKKLDFLLDNEVSLCTSLDGPDFVHNKNRLFRCGDSQKSVVRWLREIEKRRISELPPKRRVFKPSALMTTSRFSLPHPKKIVDTYMDLGLDHIFLRPLSPIGYAKRVWGKIGYTADEYLDFYRKALDYIIELNLRGKPFMERMAALLTYKILRGRDPNFLDLRSPCGASIGQLAYNYDGEVYTCDEGRMVAQQGDKMFRVGSVFDGSFESLMESPATRACCMASSLEGQPMCSRCAYKPYCGVCPVYNYEAQKSLWGLMPANMHCRVFMGIFDLLFERLDDPEKASVFESWFAQRGEVTHDLES